MISSAKPEKMFKGTMVIDLVKAIRSMKDVPWEEHLSERTTEFLSQRILAASWYEFEPVIEMLHAVFNIVGQGNHDLARQWGKINGRKLFETVYKGMMVSGDTLATLMKLRTISTSGFIKGMENEHIAIDDKHIQIKYHDDDPRTEPIYYFVQGWVDAIIEMTGSRRGKVLIVKKHWEGDDCTLFDVRWD